MLVLSRKKGETVEIGKAGDVLTGPIIVTVVEVRGDKTRIGIQADRDVPVHRGEVAEAIAREQEGK